MTGTKLSGGLLKIKKVKNTSIQGLPISPRIDMSFLQIKRSIRIVQRIFQEKGEKGYGFM